jgi:hypothetical protein
MRIAYSIICDAFADGLRWVIDNIVVR